MLRALLRNPTAVSIALLFAVLAIAIVPLSIRQARAAFWWLHAIASFALAIGVATFAYRVLFVGVVPWWHVALGYVVIVALPLLATAWLGRAVAQSWPTIHWSAMLVGAIISAVGFYAIGLRLARLWLPDVVRATA